MLPNLKREIEQLKASGCYREFVPVRSRDGATVLYKDKKIIDFTSWDLFGVNSDPDVLSSVHTNMERSGIGANSPRLSSGTSPQHESLEKRIAQVLNCPAAVLFSSRNQAVLSLVTTLLDEQSTAIGDEFLLSPVADAAYLVHAPFSSFDADNPMTLQTELEKSPEFSKKFIFIEGVSPIRGKPAESKAMFELARAHSALLVIDESFSLGVLGLRGGGMSEECVSQSMPYCCYGSLSFGLSGTGAYVAGGKDFIEYLINQSRTFLNEAPIPPALAAGLEVALDKVELSVAARERLKALGLRMKYGLSSLGISTDPVPYPIVTIPFSRRKIAAEVSDALLARGFLVELVARGGLLDAGAILRLLINSEHSELHIDAFLHAMSEIQSHLSRPM